MADSIDPRAIIRERPMPALLEAAEREYQEMASADHQHVIAAEDDRTHGEVGVEGGLERLDGAEVVADE